MRDRCVTDRLRRLQLWKADYRVRRIPEMRSESISALPAEWPFVVLTRLIKILFVMDCSGVIPINGKRSERTSREVSLHVRHTRVRTVKLRLSIPLRLLLDCGK